MAERIEINKIGTSTMLVPIVGTAPLIVHNFSEKSKRQMLESQQGKKSPKEPRDPQAEYQGAFYRIHNEGGPDKYGLPVLAFKSATVGAARFYGKDVTMTALRQFLFFSGVMTKADNQQLVEIHGEPEMREDVVRLNRGGSETRYRPMFPEWSAVLRVTFVSAALTESSVLSLIDAGGLGVGVGEWRPERSGQFGTYMVDQNAEIEVVK